MRKPLPVRALPKAHINMNIPIENLLIKQHHQHERALHHIRDVLRNFPSWEADERDVDYHLDEMDALYTRMTLDERILLEKERTAFGLSDHWNALWRSDPLPALDVSQHTTRNLPAWISV